MRRVAGVVAGRWRIDLLRSITILICLRCPVRLALLFCLLYREVLKCTTKDTADPQRQQASPGPPVFMYPANTRSKQVSRR